MKNIYKLLFAKSITKVRDKVMLGMVIFQGVKLEELDQLEIHHLDTEEATIYIPAGTRSNAQTLELHPMQMASLMTYLYEYRPKLLVLANKVTDRLFVSMGQGNSIQNSLYKMTKQLRIDHPSLKSITHLRESRMVIWVKQHGIRKAQYYSGIRYTSSMLRYKTTSLEKLKHKLAMVHPMERLKN